ncbi:MAG TPA: STAS domain-containing protein [Solirubrobacteraceae bacterium]|jgi:anti-sigma B factor antagonist|nr:STAS domain-containing protein [Solirubrobacteraceae bacterium]
MAQAELVLDRRAEGGAHTLVLTGELDLATAYELEAAALQVCTDGAHELILDLARLGFVDSAGLRALVSVRALCAEHECQLRLIDAREPLERLLELTGLARALPLERRAAATQPARESRSAGS